VIPTRHLKPCRVMAGCNISSSGPQSRSADTAHRRFYDKLIFGEHLRPRWRSEAATMSEPTILEWLQQFHPIGVALVIGLSPR
jgi:hypothetical protein